ncbi:MAG: hypothetical protein KKH94_10450 [Candidatus Omnitrophica bacterium]|nr:hypothetical protein [Candidatus Omnitrophota bacterium]
MALGILALQLKKNSEDNRSLKREELRKSFEIVAFKSINEKITEFSKKLSSVHVKYLILPCQIKWKKGLHIKDQKSWFEKQKMSLEISNDTITVREGASGFILAVEANEIAIIDYDHFRKYIQFRIEDLLDRIEDFRKYFDEQPIEDLCGPENENFRGWCNKISDLTVNITAYLSDYRIELMNHFLGNVFNNLVPLRKPMDSKFKILREVALKEEVQKEEQRRINRALNNQ